MKINKNHYCTIMAGGIGSRFWPESTEQRPKQFLDILGIGKSLIQMTWERFLKIAEPHQILVVTNTQYFELVQEQLPDLPTKNILCEPSRNNTAPCIAYAMLRILSENPNASFVVAPSDHIIEKEELFLEKIQLGFKFVEKNGGIVTLGIKPTRPDTGYGYIECGDSKEGDVLNVNTFKEKPDLELAKSYLYAGNYLWNAGIFIWNARDLKEIYKKNTPAILEILSEDLSCMGTDNEQNYIDKVYPQTPSISVDHAILEKAENVYVILADIGWSDLGTWKSLHEYVAKDDKNNFVNSEKAILDQVNNSFVKISKNKKVIIKGLDNFIIIENDDALLIYPKDQEQEIKAKVGQLNSRS